MLFILFYLLTLLLKQFQYSWLYDVEDNSNSKQNSTLALPSIEKQAIEDSKPALVETWKYRVKNSIMYVPEGMTHQLTLSLMENIYVHMILVFQ